MKYTEIKSPKKRLKILFKVSGGPDIGLGHIRRSLELAHFMKKNENVDIFFHCNTGNKRIVRNEYKFPFFFTPFNKEDCEYIPELVQEHDIDVMVIDDISIDKDLCKSIKNSKPNTLIVALDHFEYNNRYLDIIINLFNQNSRVRDPKKIFSGCYVEGLEYAIIRKALLQTGKRKKHPSGDIPKIILTFGGSDIRGNTIKILRLLSNVDQLFETCVIIGPMFKETEKIVKIAKKLKMFKIFANPKKYENYVVNADIGFVGGGTTLLEFCSVGVPVIVVPQNEAERRFASVFERQNAVILLMDTFSNEQKITIIRKIIDDKKLRDKMAANQKLLIDGRGKERISELILSRVG